MELVLDTNIAYFLFSKDPFLRDFISEKELELYSVKEMLDELKKDSSRVCKFTKRNSEEFDEIIRLLPSIITFVPAKEEFMAKAEQLISHKNDVPFLALALELNIPILSNDRHFKEQSAVRSFTMAELKELFIK